MSKLVKKKMDLNVKHCQKMKTINFPMKKTIDGPLLSINCLTMNRLWIAGVGHQWKDGAGGGTTYGDQIAIGRQRDVDAALLRNGPPDGGDVPLPSRRRPSVGLTQRRGAVREQLRHRHQDASPDAHDPRGQHRQRRAPAVGIPHFADGRQGV